MPLLHLNRKGTLPEACPRKGVGYLSQFRSRKQWHRHCHPPKPQKSQSPFSSHFRLFLTDCPARLENPTSHRAEGWQRRAAEQQSFLRQVRGLPRLCFQRKASWCWDQGRWAAGLAEVCIESSADDQPSHLTGPSSDFIQFGIS